VAYADGEDKSFLTPKAHQNGENYGDDDKKSSQNFGTIFVVTHFTHGHFSLTVDKTLQLKPEVG
jgi:hypothetical protein